MPAGTVSVIWTPLASPVPVFRAVTVKVNVSPTIPLFGHLLVIERTGSPTRTEQIDWAWAPSCDLAWASFVKVPLRAGLSAKEMD